MPERAARLVALWVRLYTRNLPPEAAGRRVGEIGADLHDHTAHERARGTAEWLIALSILARMARGLPADAAWRRSARGPRSVSRIVTVTMCALAPLAVLQAVGAMNWGLGDFVLVAVLLFAAGSLLRLAARGPSLLLRVPIGALGIAAIAFGEADDAPGLVGFGCLLLLATAAGTASGIASRRAGRRSS